MNEKCRYDYVVIAIEALSKYVGTSAVETNTMKLVENAQYAIEELIKIEEKIGAKGPSKKQNKNISSALDEFYDQFLSFQPMISKLNNFLRINKQTITLIKKIEGLDGIRPALSAASRASANITKIINRIEKTKSKIV